MTDAQVIEAANACRALFAVWWADGVRPPPKRMDTGKLARQVLARDRVAHVFYCCDQIVLFIQEGRRDKAMRWLGFVQGALWVGSFATIDELGKMNMPLEPPAGSAADPDK